MNREEYLEKVTEKIRCKKACPMIRKELMAIGMACFGIVMMLLLVVGLFLARSIKISMSQKNHFGMLLALGCSMLLAFKSGFYVLTNLGLFLGTSIDMPFMSYGFWCTVVNYILLGMILSVHRYSMVVDEMPKIKYRLVKEEIK